MEILRLRFVGGDQPDLPLDVGMHRIGQLSGGGIGRIDDGDAIALLCVDRRGVWLTVGEGRRGVHVNGRPVQRLAMLRRGDTLHLEGAELRLLGGAPVRRPGVGELATPADAAAGLHIVLRAIGGRHHGRSFTLDRPRLVGSHAEADIHIDDPAFAERHARVELVGGEVLLRDLGSADGSIVNGESVRDALLQPGDQVVFDAYHRFVIEAPLGGGSHEPALPEVELPSDEDESPGRRPWPLPWLLLTALLIAGLLSLLLLYGAD